MFYFDEVTGERRMKRRYVMAFWGFAVGSLFGFAFGRDVLLAGSRQRRRIATDVRGAGDVNEKAGWKSSRLFRFAMVEAGGDELHFENSV